MFTSPRKNNGKWTGSWVAVIRVFYHKMYGLFNSVFSERIVLNCL